jgi:pyroglutamyl-peptidase
VAFVALGLAPGEPVLRVETTAINRLDFGVADNEGARPTGGGPIDPEGPPARMASWDAPALARSLRGAGYPTRVSHFAGTHLCNATLYAALGAMEAEGLQGPAGFFHLPYLPHQVARFMDEAPPGGDVAPLTPRALPSMAFADQRAALIHLLTLLA